MDVPHLARKDFVVRWPEPAQVQLDQVLMPEEPCEVEFRTGATHTGSLLHFTGVEPYFVFQPHSGHPLALKSISVRFSNIRQLRLTRPVKVTALDNASLNESGAILVEAGPQIYSLEFHDSKIVSGETAGYVRSDAGLFLYSPKPTNEVIRSFVPETSIAYLQIGEPIGRILVAENAVSESELADALEEQQRRRSALLGDYLVDAGLTTRAQLDQALELQKVRPGLRIGEALIELGLLTSDALHTALSEQRAERVRPIGEILVEKGALDTQTFTKVWATKLGLPYVDLTHVSIHPTAINRLSARDARALMVLPLAVEKDHITLAISRPADMTMLSELSLLTGMRVMTVLASVDQIREMLDRYYPRAALWEDPVVAESAVATLRDPEESIDDILQKVLKEGETAELTDDSEVSCEQILKELLSRMMSDSLSQGELHLSIESEGAVRRLTLRFRKDRTALEQ